MNEDINEIMADASLTQDPQRQQPQPAPPRPDIINEAQGMTPAQLVEQARVRPGIDTNGVPIDQPMNNLAAQRMRAYLDSMPAVPQAPAARAPQEPQEPTVDSAREAIRQMMQADSAQLTASFDQVYKTNPDFAARADRMAKFLNIDLGTVQRNPDEIQRIFDTLDLQSRDLVRNNPALARDLTNPGFMAIAKDDLDNLSWWTSAANAWEVGALTAEMGKLGHELKFLVDRNKQAEAEPVRMRIAQIRNRMAQLPVAQEGFGSWLGSASQTVALQASLAPEAVATGAVVAGAASAVGAAASGPLAPVVGPLAGIAGFFKVGGASLTMQNMEVESGISYLQQVESGVDPEVAYYTSTVSGVLVGLVDRIGLKAAAAPAMRTLTEMTAKELAKELAKPTWGSIAKKYGTDVVKIGLTEGLTESTQDLISILAEDLGKSFTKGELETRLATEEGRKEILDKLTETFIMTLKGQALLAPVFGSPTLFGGMHQRLTHARKQRELFENIANNRADSKVAKRDPNVYEVIVQNQLDQLEQLGGADAKTVYVAPDRFLEAMKGTNTTEAMLMKMLPDQLEAIREALRNGSDIAIPTAKWAAALSDTDLGRALILDMRLSDSPNVLSAREAEAQAKDLRERVEAAAKMVDEDMAADKTLEADIRAVEDLFYEQNVVIPNIGRENAKALAVMQTRMVHALARETGMPLKQFYEKYRAQFVETGKPPMFQPGQPQPAEPTDILDQLLPSNWKDNQFADIQRSPGKGKSTATFRVVDGGPLYSVDIANVPQDGLPDAASAVVAAIKPTPTNEITFSNWEADDRFGITGSGNAFKVLSRVSALVANYLWRNSGTESVVIRAAEQNRASLYRKMAASLPSELGFETLEFDADGVTHFLMLRGDSQQAGKQELIANGVNFKAVQPVGRAVLEQVEKLDADYMAAVNSGDMEAAQRMVDQAARAAGYNETGEHGLALGELAGGSFDPAMRGKNTRAASAKLGFFFGSNKTARAYGQKTLRSDSAEGISAAARSAFAPLYDAVPVGVSKDLDYERSRGEDSFASQSTDRYEPDEFIGRIYSYAQRILDNVEFNADETPDEAATIELVQQARASLERTVGMADFESVTDVATVRVKLRMQNPLVHDQQGKQYRDKAYYDLIREAIANGNDSVIIKNTYDGGPLDDIKVVFAPEQIKSADPVTRDEQGDIIPLSRRFNLQSPSILEQLGEEQQPRLMALHNLTADNLVYAESIGGLAVPSVGVVTEKAGEVRGFGEITLIGTKSMMDPGKEPVFTSDAYSQRFPKPKWRKPTNKNAIALRDQVFDVSKEFDDDIMNYVESYAFMRPNAGELLSRWLNSNATKALWLRSKGETANPVLRDYFADNDYGFTKEVAERLRPTFDAWRTAWNEAEPESRMSLPETKALADAVKREYAKILIDGGIAKEEADRIASGIRGIGSEMTNLFRRMDEGPKPDFVATREALDKQIAGRESEFRDWSQKQVLDRFPAPYITVSGRSVAYTLDNIVEHMTNPANIAGVEKTMTFGAGMARAMTSERLESLEQMREAAKSKIVEGKEYDELAKQTDAKLSAYRDAVYRYSTESGMAPLDAAMRALAKFATRKNRTSEALRKELAKEYYDAARIPDDALQLGVEAAEALLTAPVPYFEAKPQRAVSLNEFAGAVIPQDASQETKDILTKNGIPFTTYASDAERTAVVRQFTQQLSTQRPDVLAQLANAPNPGFYSALLRSIDAVTSKALPAHGLKYQINSLVNKGTVKQAEVEWSGLNEWLDMQEGKVPKDAVVAFLQSYGVKVEAVKTKAGKPELAQDVDIVEEDSEWYIDSNIGRDGPFASEEEAYRYALQYGYTEQVEDFAAWVLPGGKNYQEVLLTLVSSVAREQEINRLTQKHSELMAARTRATDPVEKQKLIAEQKEISRLVDNLKLKTPRFPDSDHWGRDDVLAHLRMNDRVDADGKRVLFIEEVQSDWGQKGRDTGFEQDRQAERTQYAEANRLALDAANATAERRKVVARETEESFEFMSFEQWLNENIKPENQTAKEEVYNRNGYNGAKKMALISHTYKAMDADAKLRELIAEESRLYREANQLFAVATDEKIPRAPFVQTTKGWVELALKKVMLIAAEGGYDRVAFTNGAENAKRYSLSKQISKITYNQKTQELLALDLNGRPAFDQKVSPDKLHEYVGNEVAQKLTSESMRPSVMSRDEYQSRYGLANMESQLITRELSRGSRSPSSILPDAIWFVVSNEKIIGEYQSQQAAQTSKQMNIVQLEGLDLEVGGEGMKAFYDKIMPNHLNDLLAKFGKTKSTTVNVEGIGEHLGFDVTQTLRDKISEGLPLFAPTQRGTFDPRTLVSAIMSGGKADTIMHEMWHYYFVVLERMALAGDAPAKLGQDFDTLLSWLKVDGATAEERLATWRGLTFEQRKPFHENTAYAWEIWLAKGEAPSVELEGIFKRMLRWFRETYNDIVTELKALYKQNFGRDLILPTTDVEQVFARALASQEEIDRSMRIRNIQFPYSDAEQAQMRPETLNALKEMWEEMVEEAVINVTGKAISDMQWLSGAELPGLRQMQERHDAMREKVREEVAAQVAKEPLFRAVRHLTKGEIVDEQGNVTMAGSVHRLDTRKVQDMLPEGKTLSNVRGMTRRGGLDPSDVAQWYGFPDGRTLVASLANANSITEEIKQRTDKRMMDEHGELVSPVQRQRAIERAINNDTRTQFLAAVLRHTDLTLRKSVDALSPEVQKRVEDATAKLAELKQTREALRAQLKSAEESKLAEVAEATNEQLKDNQRAIARERRKVSGPITPVRELMKAAELNADKTISAKKVGEVSSYRYGQQQARASRDAAEAVKKLDLAEIARNQQKELLLHALTKKAAEVEDFVADTLDDFKKFRKDPEKLRKTRDMDLVNVAKAVLASYGMGVEMEGVQARLDTLKEQNPALYAEYEAHIADAKANARPYRDLTVEEFQAVADFVNRLWHEAKRKLEVGKGEARQSLDEVVGLLVDRMKQIGLDKVAPGSTGKETEAQKLMVQVVDAASALTRVQHWCNGMDQIAEGLAAGAFTQNIWRRIQDATSEYLLARTAEVRKLAELSKSLYTGGPTIYSEEFGYLFGNNRGRDGKAEILGDLLHMGNKDNLERHLTGRVIEQGANKGKRWGEIDPITGELDASLHMSFISKMIQSDVLVEADFDWLQNMWDLLDAITDRYIQPAHKLMTGDYLDLVPPTPFTIRFKDGTTKTYRGGYFPAKIDRDVSEVGGDIDSFEELEQDVRQRRPKAADGMTKKRKAGVQQPRVMDPLMMVQAIDEELRYSIIGPAVSDVLKIIQHPDLKSAMQRFDRNFINKTLKPWLNVVATQRITQPGKNKLIDRALTAMRRNASLQTLAFYPLNAVQNFTGVPTGIYKAGGVTYAKAVVQYLANPGKITKMIVESDGVMADRLQSQMRDAELEVKRIFENPTLFNKAVDYVRSGSFILQRVTQNVMDITVWLASYNKALKSIGAEKDNAEAHAEAVRRARETVTLTQYSQRPEDVSQVEVSTPAARLMTQFFGYINGLAQLTGSEWKKFVRSDLGLTRKSAHLVYIYLMVWLMPSLLNDLMKRASLDDWDDEDDNGYIDGMVYDVAIKPGLQTVPVAGQVLDTLVNGFDTKPYNDKLTVSPAVAMVVGEGQELVKGVSKWYRTGEVDEQIIYDAFTLMGYLTGIPTRPVVKPLEYESKVEAGKVKPTSTYDYYRGLITGRASPESRK